MIICGETVVIRFPMQPGRDAVATRVDDELVVLGGSGRNVVGKGAGVEVRVRRTRRKGGGRRPIRCREGAGHQNGVTCGGIEITQRPLHRHVHLKSDLIRGGGAQAGKQPTQGKRPQQPPRQAMFMIRHSPIQPQPRGPVSQKQCLFSSRVPAGGRFIHCRKVQAYSSGHPSAKSISPGLDHGHYLPPWSAA